MFLVRYLLVLLTTVGCGRRDSAPTTSDTVSLEQRYNEYLSIAQYGWEPYSSICDGLLFATLSAVAVNREFDVEAARDENGQWYRKPVDIYRQAPCSSTISRDMFMGLFLYSLHFKRLDILEGIRDYGQANGWVMGEESKMFETRTVFTPATRALLGRLISHLGGAKSTTSEIVPIPVATSEGFVSHLGLLTILMVGKMDGSIPDAYKDNLRDILKHMGSNPLAQALYHKYGDGDQTRATELLLNTWPAGRLPTTGDWCEEWRLQRSDGDSGFQPCEPTNKIHSGADFLFAAGVVLGKI